LTQKRIIGSKQIIDLIQMFQLSKTDLLKGEGRFQSLLVLDLKALKDLINEKAE